MCSIPDMSGVKTKMIPEQIAVKYMTNAAGSTFGSNTSFQVMRKCFTFIFSRFDNVSVAIDTMMKEMQVMNAADMNKVSNPKAW